MSIMCAKWWSGWSENEKVETIMKHLMEELSDIENCFQCYSSPRVNYERRRLHEGSNKPIKQTYFDNFMLSFQSNMMHTVVASITDGCENLLTQLRMH